MEKADWGMYGIKNAEEAAQYDAWSLWYTTFRELYGYKPVASWRACSAQDWAELTEEVRTEGSLHLRKVETEKAKYEATVAALTDGKPLTHNPFAALLVKNA